MIYILSRTTKKYQKLFPGYCIQSWRKFKDLHRNLRTFQGLPVTFKYFPRLCKPCLSGMINVIHFGCAVLARAAGIPSINNIGFLFEWSWLALIACCLRILLCISPCFCSCLVWGSNAPSVSLLWAFFLSRTFARRTYYNRIHSCFVCFIFHSPHIAPNFSVFISISQ